MWQTAETMEKTANGAIPEREFAISSHDPMKLVRWEDLPEWQKDNHYIRDYYRPP